MTYGKPRFAIAMAILALVAGLSMARAAPVPQAAQNAPMFTDEADGKNWPSVGRTYSENYYSPLSQINQSTVKRLRLAWFIDLPTMISAVSTPLEIDGTLYFAVGYSFVYAAEAATGKVLWTYDPKVTAATNDKLKQSWGIRGMAYADGRVFVGTQDGRLVALSAKDGTLLWSTETTEGNDGRFITGPPRVFNGKVIIGHGGADGPVPVRGYVSAYSVGDGHLAWRFYTVPGDPAKGFENKAMEMAAKTSTGNGGNTGRRRHENAIAYDQSANHVHRDR